MSAVGLALFFVGPLEIFGWVDGIFRTARASANRIAEVLDAAPAVGAGERPGPEQVAGAVGVRGLRHGALLGIDLDVAAGEFVGIAAADPAAATALMSCLAREAEPDAGTVELDGVALAAYAPDAARAAVIVSAHHSELFAGTVGGADRDRRPDRAPRRAPADPGRRRRHRGRAGQGLVEQGTHAELVAAGGRYAQLWQAWSAQR